MVSVLVANHRSSGRMENYEDFREFVELLLQRRVPMGYMLTGSVVELPLQYVITNLTDFDHMYFPLTLCAVSPTDPFPHKFHGDVLLVETDNAYPGFARLKYCHSSHAYLKRSQILKSSSPGPAFKGTFMSLIELNSHLSEEERQRFQKQLQDYEVTTVDLVVCVVCPIWPTAALEWIRRHRKTGWPTKELLSKVGRGGCHFVAKAHPGCPNDETLFRFSFSAAEIVLVNSWSVVQKYIYHILRLIKTCVAKQCEEKRLESAISSYTMKTLMLWACENKPPSLWDNGSITIAVTELLSELIEWLIEGRCRNYFIPSSNMFEHTTGDVGLTVDVLSSFVCNQSEIEEIAAQWSYANPEIYFSIALSDKLSLLGQLGVSQMSHLVNPIEPNLNKKLNLDQLAAGGSEFYQLVTGLLAHLQAAIDKRVGLHPTDTNGDLARTTRIHLDQAMRTTPQTKSQTYFYFGKSILENLQYVIERKKPDHHRTCIYSRIAEMSSQTQIRNKERVPSGIDMTTGIAVHWFLQGVDRSLPKASYFASAAYLANFYFTHLEQYGECLQICQEAEKQFSALNEKIGVDQLYYYVCSVVLTRKWSAIFDKCVQTVFGFILLHDQCFKRQYMETRTLVLESQSSNSFVIYIYPIVFIRYVPNQCTRRLHCTITAQDLVDQYLECSRFLIEAVCSDQIIRLTTESHKHLRTLSGVIADHMLNTNK